MNCYRGNPGCEGVAGDHEDWQLVLVSSPNEPGSGDVRAMGAGVFHFVKAGAACGAGDRTTLGTLVEVDHGGGVVSRYGHLATSPTALRAREGEFVAAGEVLGTMGTTGARSNCQTPYLDFFVMRDGEPVEMPTLTVCVANAAPGRRVQQWPADQYRGFATWNDVPRFDRYDEDRFTEFPAPEAYEEVPDDSCLPDAEPATPSRPAAPRLTRRGLVLGVSWAAASGVTGTTVEYQLYRPTLGRWLTVAWRRLPPTATSTRFLGLGKRQLARVAVSHRNATGSGRTSAWTTSTPQVPAR